MPRVGRLRQLVRQRPGQRQPKRRLGLQRQRQPRLHLLRPDAPQLHARLHLLRQRHHAQQRPDDDGRCRASVLAATDRVGLGRRVLERHHRQAEPSRAGDADRLPAKAATTADTFFGGSIAYAFSESTQLDVRASQGLAPSGTGTISKSTSAAWRLSHRFSDQLVRPAWAQATRGRPTPPALDDSADDKTITAGAGLSYRLAERWMLDAGYQYTRTRYFAGFGRSELEHRVRQHCLQLAWRLVHGVGGQPRGDAGPAGRRASFASRCRRARPGAPSAITPPESLPFDRLHAAVTSPIPGCKRPRQCVLQSEAAPKHAPMRHAAERAMREQSVTHMAMDEQISEGPEGGKTVGEYLSDLRRRKWQILAVAAILAPIDLRRGACACRRSTARRR